jgi:hypothetical protein
MALMGWNFAFYTRANKREMPDTCDRPLALLHHMRLTHVSSPLLSLGKLLDWLSDRGNKPALQRAAIEPLEAVSVNHPGLGDCGTQYVTINNTLPNMASRDHISPAPGMPQTAVRPQHV